MIEAIITSKTRRKLLSLFLTNPKTKFYVRELERETNENINSVRKELDNLEKISFLIKERSANAVYYHVNENFLFYRELRSIIKKTNPYHHLLSELKDDIKSKFSQLASIVLFGSFARDEINKDSDIDLIVIAGNLPKDWRKRDKIALEIEKNGFRYGIPAHLELLTKKEFEFSVKDGAPLLFDLSKDYKIIYDSGFFKKQIKLFKNNMVRWGAKKVDKYVWEVPKLAVKV